MATNSSRLSHDQYFAVLLEHVAKRSTCGRRSVAAIIVGADNAILSTGYNGVPRGFTHCIDEPCAGRHDQPGQTDRCHAVHAEQNALLQCHRIDLAHTLYVSCTPCFICAKMIAQTNIKHVKYLTEYADDRAKALFDTAGITLVQLAQIPVY